MRLALVYTGERWLGRSVCPKVTCHSNLLMKRGWVLEDPSIGGWRVEGPW